MHDAALMLLISGVADFLDGMMARLLKAYSEMGKQLDSLADLVSFGVAPAIIMFSVLWESELTQEIALLPYLSLCFPLAACWRLAKFNLDEGQGPNFQGLASPAAGILLASLAFEQTPQWFEEIFRDEVKVGFILLLSFLMVTSINMFSMKFGHINWQGNGIRYIFLLLCVPLSFFVGFEPVLIPLILILYIFLALVNSFIPVKKS